MNQALERVLQDPRLRRAGSRRDAGHENLSTGFPVLDKELPGGGWPMGALTEILTEAEGIGELRLLVSALARLSRKDRWIVWVTPPYIPYAPGLSRYGVDLSRTLLVRVDSEAERLWAADQALRSGVCGAVLLWPYAADDRKLRRLQLAAESGKALGVLFRPARAANHPSPAALRLRLTPSSRGLEVSVLRCRGGAPRGPLLIRPEAGYLNPEESNAPRMNAHERK